MLIILLLFTTLRLLNAAPVDSSQSDDILGRSVDDVSHGASRLRYGTRNTSEIISSCLLTILACTWTAIHPNIPGPRDSSWDVLKRRIITTVYVFIAPEAITCWALWQNISARRIMKLYNADLERENNNMVVDPPKSRFFSFFTRPSLPIQGQMNRWTMTHGFFIQMGGFMLCDKGVPIQTLAYEAPDENNVSRDWPYQIYQRTSLRYLITNKHIRTPNITRDEIMDRSKRDIISKAIAGLQTLWFVAQCIARFAIHLPVTELEIVTLAFAFLNAITYILWLHKPKEVGVPVYLKLKHVMADLSTSTQEPTQTPLLDPADSTAESLEQKSTHASPLLDSNLCEATDTKETQKTGPVWIHPLERKKSFILNNLDPLGIFKAIFRPFDKLISGSNPFNFVGVGELRVPMFHVEATDSPKFDRHSSDANIDIMIAVVFTVFGLVHLIPARFPRLYPSEAEKWTWIASAIVITVPVDILTLSLFVGNLIIRKVSDEVDNKIHEIHQKIKSKGTPYLVTFLVLRTTVSTIPFCFFPIKTLEFFPRLLLHVLIWLTIPTATTYYLARIVLVVLALLSLRDVDPGALITIDWLASTPHL